MVIMDVVFSTSFVANVYALSKLLDALAWQALEKKYEESTGLPSPEKIDARRRRKKAVGFGKS